MRIVYKIKILWVILCVVVAFKNLPGQIVHTKSFTDNLKAWDMAMRDCPECFLHAYPLEKDSFHRYNLVLKTPDDSLEYRYVFREESKTISFMPGIYLMSKITTAAMNEDPSWLFVKTLDTFEAMAKFGTDWAMWGTFRPKDSFSTHTFCKFYGIYSEGKGLVVIYILFDREAQLPHNESNLLYFNSQQIKE